MDVDELFDYLKFLGHKCKKAEVEDMIWEVDEDCDRCVSWEVRAASATRVPERPCAHRLASCLLDSCLLEVIGR